MQKHIAKQAEVQQKVNLNKQQSTTHEIDRTEIGVTNTLIME